MNLINSFFVCYSTSPVLASSEDSSASAVSSTSSVFSSCSSTTSSVSSSKLSFLDFLANNLKPLPLPPLLFPVAIKNKITPARTTNEITIKTVPKTVEFSS